MGRLSPLPNASDASLEAIWDGFEDDPFPSE